MQEEIDVEKAKKAVSAVIDGYSDELEALSHKIHDLKEVSFQEIRSAKACMAILEKYGFTITSPLANLETAFCAETGEGELEFGIFCEYDALPEIGHACGHNIIAASAIGAALSLADLTEQLGIKLKVFGTPAEEGGGGKIILLEAGVFDSLAAAMMIHPWPVELIEMPCLAVSHIDVHYFGQAAHASAFPEKGKNAADALTIAQVAIGLLRQQSRSRDQVHGIVTNGGAAPNIIPEHTVAKYYIRSETLERLVEWQAQIINCFSAGALATGCEMKIEEQSPPYSEMKSDRVLTTLYRKNAEDLGRCFESEQNQPAASTDMANVSLKIPAIHPTLGLECAPVVNHQAEFAAQCITPLADKAMLDGAKAMAHTVIDASLIFETRQYLIQKIRQRS
ncbi:MAG: M20 family metallopeptidase [Firmicutes bacterium]|jgi:amidohydrolase|nr:M20 family metallopeptidase [Bacillota bacterium]